MLLARQILNLFLRCVCFWFPDEKVVVCLLCQRTFTHQFSYSEHFKKTHLRHFLHSCDGCGRGFWKRADKTKHRCNILVNLSVQTYKLGICSVLFSFWMTVDAEAGVIAHSQR